MTAEIVCLGEVLIDMFPAEVGRKLAEVSAFHPKPGGAPANVAVAAARLGRRSAFIGKVGEDAFGHHLAEVLRSEEVDLRGLRFDAHARTTLAFIAMPDANTSEFIFYRNPGADQRLQPEELDADLLGQARALHFGSLSLAAEPMRATAAEAVRIASAGGALISFDANYRPALWAGPDEARERILPVLKHVHLLKLNEAELRLLSGSADPARGAEALLKTGVNVCVVTLGPRGSYVRSRQGGEHVPAFAVPTVDATGCGDAFVAGLLCRLIRRSDARSSADLASAVRYASAVAALMATAQGTIPALPTAAQVDAFLSERGGE